MPRQHPVHDRLALGIRQPWAELILRGAKTVEVRSVDTRVRGPIYVYASKKLAGHPAADRAAENHGIEVDTLPRGVIVGSVELVETSPCTRADARAACVPRSFVEDRFAWRLQNPERLDEPLTVRFLPYGIWFYPFKRRNGSRR